MSAPLAASLVQPVVLSLVKGRSGRRVRRTGRVKMNKNLVQPHRLSNIEITNYFNYKPRFKSVSSRNNLPRIKDGALVINLDDKKNKATQWISLFIGRNTAVYFDSYGIEYIPLEVLNKWNIVVKWKT